MLHTLTDSQRTLVETLGNAKAVKLDVAALAEQTGISQHRVLELVAQLQSRGVLTLNSTVPARVTVNWPKEA